MVGLTLDGLYVEVHQSWTGQGSNSLGVQGQRAGVSPGGQL